MPTTTEPVAWDPHSKIDPDLPLADLPVCGLAVATAGQEDPVASPLLGLQTANGDDIRASLFRPEAPLPTDAHGRHPASQSGGRSESPVQRVAKW